MSDARSAPALPMGVPPSTVPEEILEQIPIRALTQAQLVQLGSYVALLQASQKVMNLTAIREFSQVWSRLVLDALMLVPLFEHVPEGGRVLDVGCGAGIPGVPLAIALPRLQFTLLDATAKKIGFVRHVARELELGNLQAVSARAETLASLGGAPSCRETFDVVTARAVARLPTLLELTAPFARAPTADDPQGGILLLVKGEQAGEEVADAAAAARIMGVRHLETRRVSTGSIVVYGKTARTPPGYPRADGTPKKKPL